MCFGFLGIQFGFALQNANVSRIFETLGASIEDIPILWIAAPVTGLLVQPIIGYMSDRTWGRLGRRRPYFLFGAIFTSVALLVMPNSPTLWIAAGTLWILDASINISMEPFRAFVGDNLPRQQRTLGFAMQSFFIGIGAVVASALPWIMTNWMGVENTAPPGQIPDSVAYAFYFGAVVLLISILWTVLRSREYSPEDLERFEAAEAAVLGMESPELEPAERPNYLLRGIIWVLAGAACSAWIAFQGLDKQLYILAVGAAAFGLLLLGVAAAGNRSNPVVEIVNDLHNMPRKMKQLAVVQAFCWFALFSMWIYTTAAVTGYHFGSSDASSEAYNEGANWVGVLFAAYNGFAALAAFVIPWLARTTNRRVAHLIALTCGGIGLISFYFISDPRWLLASMVGVGIAWASILSMPYAMLAGALPAKKMGIYMGIFNFFIVIPQILSATVVGVLVRTLFDGEPIKALVLGGILFIVGGLVTVALVEPARSPVPDGEGVPA
ncbi:MAG: MFS transporter [Pseudomonadota bacterium]